MNSRYLNYCSKIIVIATIFDELQWKKNCVDSLCYSHFSTIFYSTMFAFRTAPHCRPRCCYPWFFPIFSQFHCTGELRCFGCEICAMGSSHVTGLSTRRACVCGDMAGWLPSCRAVGEKQTRTRQIANPTCQRGLSTCKLFLYSSVWREWGT